MVFLLLLPRGHCVLSSILHGCSAPVWSPPPLHTGFLPHLSCTATPLPPVCRGQSHSSSALSLRPSLETPPQWQTGCVAFFHVHLKKTCYCVVYLWNHIPIKTMQMSWPEVNPCKLWLPCWFLKGQSSLRTFFPLHQTWKEFVYMVLFSKISQNLSSSYLLSVSQHVNYLEAEARCN